MTCLKSNLVIFSFHLNPSVTHAINSKSPGFVSEVITPTISTAHSSFTGTSFPKMIYYHLPEKGQQETGENSDLQKYNRQWLFPMSRCLCEENGGTRTVPNKIESEKWKHAEQLTLPDLGGQGRGECREITNRFYLYSKKIFKFTM